MTSSPTFSAALGWDHAVAEIPPTGLRVSRAAEPGERAAIARALDLLDCTRLAADYVLSPSGGGRYRLSGTVRCEVVQACVVTLEPVANTIAEQLDASFWPADEVPAPHSGVLDLDGEEDPEPITAGRIAVGALIYQCVAAAVDPFPRKPEAMLEHSSSGSGQGVGQGVEGAGQGAAEGAGQGGGQGAGEGADSPFAVLARLRDKR